MSGIVHLVGAGPGAPDLLTLRAARLLAEADVVLVDRLVNPDTLNLVADHAEVIDVGKPLGGDQDAVQDAITHLMISRARAGSTVVRLKGGDPMVFGRGGEEVQALAAAGVKIEVTPGVSSVLAAAASGQFGLTHRGVASAFAVVTGTGVSGIDWNRYVTVDTLVILMGVGRRIRIATELIAAGRKNTQPVAFIESASLPSERIVYSTLDLVAAGQVDITNPAV
ncbi:MAG: uroporphyrinogen-III C-methyltransferase, partial [Acidimicrobiia bacterium]